MNLKLTVVLLVLLFTACTATPKRTEHVEKMTVNMSMDVQVNATGSTSDDERSNEFVKAILKQVIAGESVSGQLMMGCGLYRRAHGRWPRNQQEVAEGLSLENLPASKLSDLDTLTLKEVGDTLFVAFVAKGNGRPSGSFELTVPVEESKRVEPRI